MKIKDNRESASRAITKFVWHLSRYKPSPPSTKELHVQPVVGPWWWSSGQCAPLQLSCSNPAEAYSFFCTIFWKRTKIQKLGRGWQFFKKVLHWAEKIILAGTNSPPSFLFCCGWFINAILCYRYVDKKWSSHHQQSSYLDVYDSNFRTNYCSATSKQATRPSKNVSSSFSPFLSRSERERERESLLQKLFRSFCEKME